MKNGFDMKVQKCLLYSQEGLYSCKVAQTDIVSVGLDFMNRASGCNAVVYIIAERMFFIIALNTTADILLSQSQHLSKQT